ncbi:unnamed protein product [Linum tenue]|uniref:Uncharacterized protein n=1 Tax=Linum tenue TaxID=586396 RepID=A0AAV0RPB6_9ROSI|nr:unnamed protein product [Linum tenue]
MKLSCLVLSCRQESGNYASETLRHLMEV